MEEERGEDKVRHGFHEVTRIKGTGTEEAVYPPKSAILKPVTLMIEPTGKPLGQVPSR